jgi:hypothetical protein
MGLLLFDAFEEATPTPEPEAVFVRAPVGRTVVHGYGGTPRTFAPKDPNEVDFINFDFSKTLALVGDTIDEIDSVELENSSDAALTLDLFAHENGIVSARWRSGTEGVTYTSRVRVTTVGGRTWDLSGYVLIAAH